MDKIYIDNKELDIDESTIIQYDFQVKDIVDLTVNKVNKTKSIKVKSTPVNDAVFGQYGVLAAINEFNKEQHIGEIWRNGALVFSGRVYLLGDSKVGSYNVYEFILISGNTGWLQNIEGKKLTDLQIDQYYHTFDETTVSANDQDDTATWCYPMIRYGAPRYNANMWGWYGYGLNDRNKIALRVSRLFELIEEETGYTFEGGILADDKFTKLWELQQTYKKVIDETMNWDEHQGAATPRFSLNFAISAGGTWYFPVGCQFTIDEATTHMTTGGYFSPSTDRVMQIFTSLSFTEATSGTTAFPVKARILVDDYVNSSNYTTMATIESGYIDEDSLDWTGEPVLFEGGKTYRFRFEFFGYIGQPNCYIEMQNISLRLEITKELTKGEEVTMANFLPDITLIDYIKKFQKLFNLYFLTNDKTKTVYIEDVNRFYQYSNIIDLRGRVDNNSEIRVKDLIGDISSRELKYNPSGDAFQAYGEDHKLELINPYVNDTPKVDRLAWQYTYFGGFPPWQTMEKLPQMYIYKDGEVERNLSNAERLLYYGGEITLSGIGIQYDDTYLTELTHWKMVALDNGGGSHKIDYSVFHTDRLSKQLNGKVVELICYLYDHELEQFLYPMNGHNSLRSVVLFEDTNGDLIYGEISVVNFIEKMDDMNRCRITILTVNPIGNITSGTITPVDTAIMANDTDTIDYDNSSNTIDYE